jgi:hypothetical protein
MQWRRVSVLAAVLLLAGALVTDAIAQRRDRDRDRDDDNDGRRSRGEWVLLGEQSVGFRVDRDVINIAQSEEWYRERAFRRLHLIAERNDIYLLEVRLVYINGYSEEFRVDRLIREGQDQSIDLRDEKRFLRRLELTYRSRPNFEGRAVMKVYGEPSRRFGPGPGPLPPIGTGPEGGGDWIELGCKQVSLFGTDRDSVRVGRQEGRFKAIRLHVRGADVEMRDLRVIYANGDPDEIQIRNFLRQGQRTRPLELRGWQRSIDRVDMVYRTIPNFKGLATVCVEGLQ